MSALAAPLCTSVIYFSLPDASLFFSSLSTIFHVFIIINFLSVLSVDACCLFFAFDLVAVVVVVEIGVCFDGVHSERYFVDEMETRRAPREPAKSTDTYK